MSTSWRNRFLFVLSYSLSFTNAATDGCNFQAVSVPIRDVEFANKGVYRGIALSFGNPPQNLALTPQGGLNHTWIFDEGLCDVGQPDERCSTRRGGLFLEGQSTSFQNVTDSIDPLTLNDTGTVTRGFFGADDVALNSNMTLPLFTFGVQRMPWPQWNADYQTQHAVGLAQNSTVMSALRSAGRTGSRTWSLFWGLTGATQATQMDGGLVFGGYDAAKVKGKNFTQPLSSSTKCASRMLVTIRDMEVNFPNGTSASMFSKGVLTACIKPEFPSIITIPRDPYYNNFESLTRTSSYGHSFSYNFQEMLYDPDKVFAGDLTITFDNDLSIRIPNSQLVLPEIQVASNGSTYTNYTHSTVMMGAVESDNIGTLPLIGRQFFTSAYVMVDYETNAFTLWEANPTTDTNLVPILDTEAKATCPDDAPAVSSSATAAAGTPSSTASEGMDGSSSKAMSSGTIAGIAIGGVVAVALLGTLIFFLRKWSRSPGKSRMITSEHEQPSLLSDDYTKSWSVPPQELPARSRMAELSSSRPMRELPASPVVARPKSRRSNGTEVFEIG